MILVAKHHESMLDPWILAHWRRRARSATWRRPELFELSRSAQGSCAALSAPSRSSGWDRRPRRSRTGRRSCSPKIRFSACVPQGTSLPYRNRPWLRGAARLALASGTLIVPVCIVGSEQALRPRKFKVGLPKLKVIVCEPIAVEQARPSVATAKALTAQIERVIETAREPFGPPQHVWFPDEKAASETS